MEAADAMTKALEHYSNIENFSEWAESYLRSCPGADVYSWE